MDLQSNNLISAVTELVESGYLTDLRIKDGQIVNVSNGKPLDPGTLMVDAAYMFETAPDSGDASSVYAISSEGGKLKGLLIDAFNYVENMCASDVLERLRTTDMTIIDENSANVPMRYGVRKVFKAEFNEDPDRFVLRLNFPDFPECPFGQSFSMLGFDTAEQEYVWLVSSILKDDRLQRIPYQGEINDPDI